MQFEVPQFIEIEDKIIGPLTWKQFIYVAGGVGMLIVLYAYLPFFLFVLLGLPLGVLAGSLAFHKVNSRPFSYFLEAVVTYLAKKKMYLWRRSQIQEIVEHTEQKEEVVTPAPIAFTGKRSVQSLSKKLEINM